MEQCSHAEKYPAVVCHPCNSCSINILQAGGVIYIEIYIGGASESFEIVPIQNSKYQNLKKIRTHPYTKCEENYDPHNCTNIKKYNECKRYRSTMGHIMSAYHTNRLKRDTMLGVSIGIP